METQTLGRATLRTRAFREYVGFMSLSTLAGYFALELNISHVRILWHFGANLFSLRLVVGQAPPPPQTASALRQVTWYLWSLRSPRAAEGCGSPHGGRLKRSPLAAAPAWTN